MVLNFLFTKTLYIDLAPSHSPHPHPTPAALEQSPRVIWDAASQTALLILPQIKLNLQLSSCAFFLVDITWKPK